MKFNKNLIIILAFATFISSCGSIKKSLSGAKQDNYDEFTVKNKDPLIIPPNFDDLPEPEGVNDNNKSESVNLDFSNDTIIFDTSFNSIGTPTKSLIVYNNNNFPAITNISLKTIFII